MASWAGGRGAGLDRVEPVARARCGRAAAGPARWRAGSPEVDPHPGQDVVEAHRAARRGRAATGRRAGAVGAHALAEEDAEEVGELAGVGGPELVADVAAAEPVERARRSAPAARAWLIGLPVRTELVVLLALGGIAEDLVGLVDLLELALGSRIARLGIGVMLPGELAEGLLDLSL